ncbi:MAG TPA: SRPBCC domain-containing protein [Devosiaceae bacterium]|jgi:uncharacterized protein YndB with AHSA1/START domain
MATAIDPSSQPDDETLVIERIFDAPRALVFRLWSSPEHIVRWWGPEGYHLSSCSMDFREGGEWRFCMSRPERNHWIHGVYREIAPPGRLSFTYINDADGHEMLVTLDFTEQDGKTLMRFRQAPFMNVRERDGHGWGWSSSFDLFSQYLRVHGNSGVWTSVTLPRREDGASIDISSARERARQEDAGPFVGESNGNDTARN